MPTSAQYQEYLQIVSNPDKINKIAKLEFLNPDGTTAFVIDNNYKRGYGGYSSESRAFLQDGTLNVSLQNGQRRKANIILENLDGAFDFAVNKLWFGQQVRLLMGLRLKDGSDFYLPQGVFYFDNPTLDWKPNSRKANYQLIDKWGYLDGTVFGELPETYSIPMGSNLFDGMLAVLQLSKYTFKSTDIQIDMLDNIVPLFTNYFNNRTTVVNGQTFTNNLVPDDITVEYGKFCSTILLELNDLIAGWIGYDNTGRLTVLPSENDINDQTKPILWDYSANSKTFLGLTETSNTGDVYNEVVIVGEALNSDVAPQGRAINNDTTSDTNINRIGRKTYFESASGYYTNQQCAALAAFRLQRSTVLQKSVSLSSSQMFHLQENNLITVRRTDKNGNPIERHLIQSFSLPLAQNNEMTITATSVTDYPNITIIEGE